MKLGTPICIYQKSGGTYPSVPDELLYQQSAAPAPGGFVIRNDTLLVTVWRFSFNGGLMRYERDTEDPERSWKFNSIYKSENPDKFGSGTGYGISAAIADDPEVMLVGEPRWSPPDFSLFSPGLINFPNRVFSNSDFEVAPGSSFLNVTFDFPGLDTQFLFVQLLGFFDISLPESCDGLPLPAQATIDDFTFTTVDDEFVLDGPLGVPITLSDIEIGLTMTGASDPSPIDLFGSTTFDGMTVQIDAMVKFGILPPVPFSASGDQSSPMPAVFSGGIFGQPLSFSIPDLNLDFEPDLGLGNLNPTMNAQGSVTAMGPEACVVDFNGDGMLNFFDVSAFLVAYQDTDPIADLNADGFFDFFDVSAFLTAYQAGCP
jgi:hypothetical protein